MPQKMFEYRIGKSMLQVNQNIVDSKAQDGEGAEQMIEQR